MSGVEGGGREDRHKKACYKPIFGEIYVTGMLQELWKMHSDDALVVN